MTDGENLDTMYGDVIAESQTHGSGGGSAASPIGIADAAPADVGAIVEPLFREYGEWVARRLQDDAGITLTATDLDRHHDAFRAELPRLLGARGRLLVARLDDEPVGVAALKPIDSATAEVKRMFVRPGARGNGVGRALLTRLVDDARHEGYVTVRLETLRFMTAAGALYRTFGFVDVETYEGSETAGTPLDPLTISMALTVNARPNRTSPVCGTPRVW